MYESSGPRESDESGESGEPGELDESGKLDEYGEPGSKEEKSLLEEEINGDADQPTNRANIEQSDLSKLENRKGRDLQCLYGSL